MVFVYHKEAGAAFLTLDDESYHYLFRVRRHSVGDVISFANCEDVTLYEYKVLEITKKSASLALCGVTSQPHQTSSLHIGWCVIDPKVIEKTLPMLNELGVKKITFIMSDRSQKNYKIDIVKLQRIALSSSQQCGRLSLMAFELCPSLDTFLVLYPDSAMIDFSTESNHGVTRSLETYVIGCEGGFTQRERGLFSKNPIIGIPVASVLRSETAVVTVAGHYLWS